MIFLLFIFIFSYCSDPLGYRLILRYFRNVFLSQGVNRAFPFVASDEADDVVEVQTPMLFKLVRFNRICLNLFELE